MIELIVYFSFVCLVFISVGIACVFEELVKVNSSLTAIAEYNKRQLRLMEKHDRSSL
jgi:hypothetical protein